MNMNRIRWARMLTRFDLEPIIGAVLGNGLLLSGVLIVASLCLGKINGVANEFYFMHSSCIPRLIVQDFQRSGMPDFWPRLFLDLGIGVLIATSWVRILITIFYSIFIARDWKRACIMGFTLIILSIALLTNFL